MREEPQPQGAERLEWFLLTTLGVETQRQAEQVLEWYGLRSTHRVLAGQVQQHRRAERIERAVTTR